MNWDICSIYGKKLLRKRSEVAFSPTNVVLISGLYGEESIDIFIRVMQEKTRNWEAGIDVTEDEIERNQVYLFDTKTNRYIEYALDKLIYNYKFIAFGLPKKSRTDFEKFVQELPGRRLTKDELSDLRGVTSSSF